MTNVLDFKLSPVVSRLDKAEVSESVTSLDSRRPSVTGDATCLHCNKTWTAVAPLGTTALECPNCQLMRGAWLNHTFPDIPVLTCHCGNSFMFILDNGRSMCARCLDFTS
jgi:hypothetical protein